MSIKVPPEPKTPWEVAVDWYNEADITRAITRAGSDNFGALPKIPEVCSVEFPAWFTHQIRLAMAKGIQLGRGD